MIAFWVTSCEGYKICVQTFFLHVAASNIICWKHCFCSIVLPLLLHHDQLTLFMWVYFGILYYNTFLNEYILHIASSIQYSLVQSFSRVRLFATPWTAARQASLSITNSQSLPKLMSIESVMPSNHLILCRPLLLLPSTFPSIRVFSNELALRISWP